MKSRLPKKVVSIVVFVVPIIILIVTPALALANEPFVPIVGIPGVSATPDFNSYVNALYLLSISLAALLAVVKIILAGVQWMFSDVVTDISLAKQNIRGALIGLLIVMSAVLVLRTINPDLTTLKALGDRDDIKFSGGSDDNLDKNKSEELLTNVTTCSDDCRSEAVTCLEQSSVEKIMRYEINSSNKLLQCFEMPCTGACEIGAGTITITENNQDKIIVYKATCESQPNRKYVEAINADDTRSGSCAESTGIEVSITNNTPGVDPNSGKAEADLVFRDGELTAQGTIDLDNDGLFLYCENNDQNCYNFCTESGASVSINGNCWIRDSEIVADIKSNLGL